MVGDWVLTGGSIDGEDAPVLPDHRITMTITGSQISGSAACNGYGGEITMGADGLHLDDLAQTAWPAWTRRQWPRRPRTWRPWCGSVRSCRDGDELVARGDGVELRFAGLAPPPTAELVGTTWVLETVLVGDVAASPMGEPATLELNEDGTFTGSTGCRTLLRRLDRAG